MEDLIKQIQERTGLPADKALEVVTVVTEFLKDNLPEDLINQITMYLAKAASTASDTASTAGSAAATGASGAVGMAVGAASTVFSKTMDVVSDIVAGANTQDAEDEAKTETTDE